MDDKPKSAEEFLSELHGEKPAHWAHPSAAYLENKKKEDAAATQKAADEKESDALTRGAVGAGVGAYAVHKNIIPRAFKAAFKGDPTVYGGGAPTPTGNAPRMRVEPSMGSNSLMPGNPSESTVTRVMQSISPNENGFGTGRQREDAQHIKSNRSAILLEEARKNPNFVPAIIEGGEMFPTRSGVLLHQNEAEIMADEQDALKRRNADIADQAETDARNRAERAANNAADAQAKAARRAEMMRKGLGALKVGAGALGGYFTGRDVIDIAPTVLKKGINLDQYTKEEKDKLLNTAGGLSMMIPHPATQLLGAAMIGKGHQDDLSSALDRLAPKRKTK
jgi:hypothetical protein